MKQLAQDTKKNCIYVLVLVLLIFLTFFLLFRNTDMNEFLRVLRRTNKLWIALAILMVFVSMSFGALGLMVLTKTIDRKIAFRTAIKYVGIDFYFAAITPSATGGQPAEAYYMAKDNIPVHNSSIILMLNTILYKVVLLILGVLSLIFYRPLVLYNGRLFTCLFVLGFVSNILFIMMLLAFMYSNTVLERIGNSLIRFAGRRHWLKHPDKTEEKFHVALHEYHNAAELIRRKPLAVLSTIGFIMVQRIALFTIGFIVYLAFRQNTFSFTEMLVLQVIMAIAVDSLPLPGGVGASEGIFLIIYRKAYSISMIKPAMLLTRGACYYFYLIISGVLTIMAQTRLIRRRKHKTITHKKQES